MHRYILLDSVARLDYAQSTQSYLYVMSSVVGGGISRGLPFWSLGTLSWYASVVFTPSNVAFDTHSYLKLYDNFTICRRGASYR